MLEGLLAGKALVDCDAGVVPKLAPPNKELEPEEAIGSLLYEIQAHSNDATSQR